MGMRLYCSTVALEVRLAALKPCHQPRAPHRYLCRAIPAHFSRALAADEAADFRLDQSIIPYAEVVENPAKIGREAPEIEASLCVRIAQR